MFEGYYEALSGFFFMEANLALGLKFFGNRLFFFHLTIFCIIWYTFFWRIFTPLNFHRFNVYF